MQYLSKQLSKWLLKSGAISDSELELYEYAIFTFLLTFFPITLSFFIGTILGKPIESLFLIVPFVFLRKFSGGYHLSSPIKCFLTSTALLVISQLTVNTIISNHNYFVFAIVQVLAILTVYTLSPIDSEQRKLNDKEISLFRKIARIILLAIITLEILFFIFHKANLGIRLGFGIILVAALQLPAMISKRI